MWFDVILAYLLICVGIAARELGHAYGCKRFGIPVREVSLLGWQLPGVPPLVLPIQVAAFPETRWVIHPFIVGAYMQPDEAAVTAAPRRHRLHMLAMGPIASCLFGFACLLAASAFAALLGSPKTWVMSGVVPITIVATCFAVLYAWRAAPPLWGALFALGLLFVPFLLIGIATEAMAVWRGQKDWVETFPGIIGIFPLMHRSMLQMWPVAASTIAEHGYRICMVAGYASLIIGIANMGPLIAGDGTMMLMEFLPERLAKVVWLVTIGLILPLLVVGIASDIALISRWLFGLRGSSTAFAW